MAFKIRCKRFKFKMLREGHVPHDNERRGMSAVDEVMLKLPDETASQLDEFLTYAPRWLVESFRCVTMEKGQILMREGTPADKVYILLDGRVTAADLRVETARYDYMTFYPIEVFGAMEFLADLDTVQTTLVTARKCLFLETSADRFEKWMHQDLHALLMQTRSMTRYLLEQAKDTRLNLLLQGEERVYLYLVRQYEKNSRDAMCVITKSLEEIANATGLSLRTVNRSLADMIEKETVTRQGRKLSINADQYEIMRHILDQKIYHFECADKK